MGRRSESSWRVLFILSLVLAVLFAAPLTSFGQAKQTDGVDKDNPFDRLQSQQRQNGTVTPAYRDRILHEAQKHNQRMGLDSGGAVLGTPGQGTSGPAWINIGPFGQQFDQNGGFTGEYVDSGRLRTILTHPTDPNIVYILSSAGGLWKTANFEATTPNWTPLTDFLPTTAGGAVAFGRTPSVLYLGLGDPYDQITVGGSIVKSTDGGATWSPMITLGNTISVRDVKVDTTGTTDVVLVATDGGLWRSTDAGVTYAQVTGVQFQNQYIWSLTRTSAGWVMATQETQPITNGNCIPATRWCTGGGHIYVSTDKGLHWTEKFNGNLNTFGRVTLASIDGGDVVYALAGLPASGTLAAQGTSAATNQRDVFRSADGGLTWVALGVDSTKAPLNPLPYQTNMNILNGQAWYNQTIGVDPNDATGNTLYIGGTYSLAKSTDGGASWTVLSQWLYHYTPGVPYIHADMHAMAFKTAGTKMSLVGTDGGIFASSDNGTTWDSTKNVNLATHMFYSITGNPFFPNFAMGGLQDNGTRVRVDDTGIFNQSLGGDGFGVAMSQANTEVSLQSVYYNKIQRWRTGVPPQNYTQSDLSLGGQSSSSSPFNTPVIAPGPLADPSGLIFFSQGLTRLYKTTNGLTWVAFSTIGATPGLSGVSFRDSPFGLGISPTKINHLAVGTNGGRVYVSLDDGANWSYTLASDGVQGWPGFVSSVTWGDDNTIWATSTAQSEGLYTGVTTVRVVKSTDQGATWTAAGSGLPDVPVTRVQVDPRNTDTVYAATHVGVYRTTDGGATWTPYGSGLPNVRVNDLYMPPDGGYLRIATYGRGIWQLSNVDYVGAALVNDGAACDTHTGNIGNNETGHLNLTFRNARAAAVAGGTVSVTSDNPLLIFTAGHDAALGTVAANGTATASYAVKVVGATGIQTANLTITYGDSAPVTIKRAIQFNYDDKANRSGDTVNWESQFSGWTVTTGALKLGDITAWERRELTPVLHHMAVTDANGNQDTSLVSPVLHVGAAASRFSFNHRFNFENGWDGGIVEISTDNGTSWTTLSTFTAGGYTATLLPNISPYFNDNVLANLPAWTGLSAGWPAYMNTAVDLGTTYANQDVRIRLRATADGGGGRQGWEVSDMSFVGLTNTPFGTVTTHNEACSSAVSLSSTPNPSMYPDVATFAAVVSGGVTPVTGDVVFKEGATTLGTVTTASGTATLPLSTLATGTHNIVASYLGDAGHAPASSAIYKHTVLAVPRTTFTPNTLDFGDVHLGFTSAIMTSVLKNVGTAQLTIGGIVASGNYKQTNNCPTLLAPNASCTVSITLKPVGVPGVRTGTVSLTSDKISGDATIALTGRGVSSGVAFNRTSVPFANTLVGFTAPVQTMTVTNNGNLPLTIATIAITGEYTQTNTCPDPATPLAVDASCTVTATFIPTAVGNRAGTLTLTTDAVDSPHALAISGKGEHIQVSGTISQTVAKTAAATFPLTLKSSTGFAGVINLTCTGAPALTTCAFNPASPTMVVSGTTAVAVTVTPAPTTTTTTASARTGQIFFAAFGLFGLLLMPLARKASGFKVLSTILLVMVITISVGGMVACGGSSTPAPAPVTHTVTNYAAPGTYPVTVTAKDAAGTTLQTQTLTLTLQ